MIPPWQKLGFKLKLGLRSRHESQWLPLKDIFGDNDERATQIDQKSHLFATKHAEVFSALPAAESASLELLELVYEHISKYHLSTPPPINPALHPLESAARSLPEDLLLIAPRYISNSSQSDAISWHLEAAALAFPAHWVLAEKMNQPLRAIHQPVPHYDEKLASPVDRFFTTMQIGPISSRQNWSLQFGDQLFSPQRSKRQSSTTNNGLEELFLRIENQTLRKLPKTGYVAFTIRTHLLPMTLWQEDRDALQSLFEMMQEMSTGTKLYKGTSLFAPVIKNALKKLGE